MRDYAVLIAGGGPTGLMLAGELALAGVDVAIIERREGEGLGGRRAGGLHARTIEIFDQRGIADRFLAEGQKAQTAGFGGVRFDLADFPTRHPYGLALWQVHIERILGGWVAELGVPIYRGVEVVDVAQDGAGVDVTLSDGQPLRAQWVVGCDGGRSIVRKAAGIAFPGAEATTSNIIGEVEMTTIPEFGVHRTALGIHSFGRSDYRIVDGKVVYADTGPIGVMVTEPRIGEGEPTLADLSAALVAATGTDFGAHTPTYLSRFTDAVRQAETYRRGRVLVAGDAAHIHPPDGGQGLQTGVQDAVNLGWKLAEVVKGVAPEGLLDTYQAERHPVAARVLRHTMVSVAMRRDDERGRALRDTMSEFLNLGEPRRYFAGEMSELAIRYDLGDGHALLGRRMPDRDLEIGGARTRVYELMHRAQPLLLNFGEPGSIELGPWAGRVQLVDAATDGGWELPVVGTVPAPRAVLVRPDGYVAWVGEGNRDGLDEALSTWFGVP